MKNIALFLFLILPGFEAFGQFPEKMIGEWQGTGTLYNSPATFELSWKPVLGSKFVKLTFSNALDNGQFSMQSYAYYQIKEDNSFTGQWFDSRGITFPVYGTISRNKVLTQWGSSDIEEGRTEYELLESGELHVTDFVLQDGEYNLFGQATYKSKINYDNE